MTLFVQLYESNEEAVKSEVATFLEAFPDGAVFANTANGQGYDLVLFGQLDGGKINVDNVQARLNDPKNADDRAIAPRDRNQFGCGSVRHLRRPQPRSEVWFDRDPKVTINTDRNLRLQYLAGLGLNLYQSDPIYRSMIRDAGIPRISSRARRRRCRRCGRASRRRSAAPLRSRQA